MAIWRRGVVVAVGVAVGAREMTSVALASTTHVHPWSVRVGFGCGREITANFQSTLTSLSTKNWLTLAAAHRVGSQLVACLPASLDIPGRTLFGFHRDSISSVQPSANFSSLVLGGGVLGFPFVASGLPGVVSTPSLGCSDLSSSWHSRTYTILRVVSGSSVYGMLHPSSAAVVPWQTMPEEEGDRCARRLARGHRIGQEGM